MDKFGDRQGVVAIQTQNGRFKQMIPLVVRSEYSLLQGTASVRSLCAAARRMGYQRLALTDTDNLYGLWPFVHACRREGIVPVIGAELTDPRSKRRTVCLVETETGYRNLCRLITRRHSDSGFDLETAVVDLAEGLTLLTDRTELLSAWHGAGLHIVALMGRPLPGGHPLCRAAGQLGIPRVAVPDSYFLNSDDFPVHRVLRAIAAKSTLSKLEATATADPAAYLADPKTYLRRFAACPAVVDASEKLAEALTFTGPNFGVVMPPLEGRYDKTAARELRKAAYSGAKRRYGEDLAGPVVERLERELSLIQERNFSGYFLIVRDIVLRSSRTCGRGSGAASLVAYCLGITHVCPIKHNLYFERFLNPGRTDPPDIDLDFAWDERDAVLESVLSQYAGRSAMVANHVRFQPRMAVREVARVYGLPEGEIGKVTGRLPGHWHTGRSGGDLLEIVKRRPRSRNLDLPPPWPEIFALAGRVVGIPRHLSVHPGGVVITPESIDRYVPVERAPKGVPVIQWEKDGTEDAGLVKIDLLGNRSLGVIRDCLAGLNKNGIQMDETGWEPEDDFATQEAVAQGRTMGCFYIESPAMRLLQKKSGVGDFHHLVIHSSIIRPAANDCIREYLHRLHGGPWMPLHPLLKDVLEETFGIMVYQEDVSRVAVTLAGFTHAEADRLRKVMSKKDRQFELKDFEIRFAEGARGRGVSETCITAVWDMMLSFSGYSFCKPHSASYARVSFQAAYLKVHHPSEFMAAVISNGGGFYSTFAYVSEARRMGLQILPPDVNRSEIRWNGRNGRIRTGLMAVKGLSGGTLNRIVRQRPYSHIRDFLSRVCPDETEARALIHAGALDRLSAENSRAALFWEVATRQKLESRHPDPLLGEVNAKPVATPQFPPEDERDRLRQEFKTLGFLCDRHPMAFYRQNLDRKKVISIAESYQHVGRRIETAGWLITGKTVRTRRGDPMEFLTFEDETGTIETTLFPEVHRRLAHLLEWNRPFLLSGRVESDWGAATLNVEEAKQLRG